jgi:hypothetical protein
MFVWAIFLAMVLVIILPAVVALLVIGVPIDPVEDGMEDRIV